MDGTQDWRLIILRAATHKTERGDHYFCLNRSHYTDTDPTGKEREATAGIESRISSPRVVRSTDWATAPHISEQKYKKRFCSSARCRSGFV